MKAKLDTNRLLGKRVEHIVFGKGRIERVEDDHIFVTFGGSERMFEYPSAFGSYMTIEDKRLRPFLPECHPANVVPRRVGAPRQPYIRDEYDTAILADMVHCTL